jgi:hypothetical protein
MTIAPDRTSPDDMLALFVCRDWAALSRLCLDGLAAFRRETFFHVGPAMQHRINVFVTHFLFLFSQPEYVIPLEHRLAFIEAGPALANLVAMSSTRSTDAWLPIINRQDDNVAKLLTLYSPRNRTPAPPAIFFDANREAASAWLEASLGLLPSVLADQRGYDHLRALVADVDVRYVPRQALHHVYAGVTCIDTDRVRPVREHIHAQMRRTLTPPPAPLGRKRLGIVCRAWHPGTSAYRHYRDVVAALAETHELVLVSAGPREGDVDAELFTRRVEVHLGAAGLPLDDLVASDVRMLHFLDLGQSAESLWLANLRLAPIQVAWGHSSSGAYIDYLLVGQDVLPPDCSERPVVLPGHGLPHVWPQPWASPRSIERDRIVVNCVGAISYPLLRTLHTIQARCSAHRVLFRVFPGRSVLRDNHYLPFVHSVRHVLGHDGVEVIPWLPYEDYRSEMARGHLSLEVFPAGSHSAVLDSLHLRQPVVTLDGLPRVGSALVRSLGLDALSTGSTDEYIDRAVRLITHPAEREVVQRQLDTASLSALHAPVASFTAAVEYLMTHHESLQSDGSRAPLQVR